MNNPFRLVPLLLLIGACRASSESNNRAGQPNASANGTQAQTVRRDTPFKLGVNVSTINYWDGNRPFLNLIYGSSWLMQHTRPAGNYEEVPPSSLDAHGWVKSLPPGYRVVRGLSVPLAAGEFACRYEGAGRISVEGPAVSDVAMSPGVTRFALKATYPSPQAATLKYNLDSTDYIRNIDCREANAAATSTVAPEFISALRPFKVVRFLNWQSATPENTSVSWTGRNKPGDGDYLKRDGVPVELIVETANELRADPWLTVPWNADDHYVTSFAEYVRDNLAPGRQVYVEVSNEVWNGGYAASGQACNEAKAEGLPGVNGGSGCSLERYAEKTKQVMQIWSSVFKGQMKRLVRVASFNHVATFWSNAMLRYQDLGHSVDALASAPYFSHQITDIMTRDQIMLALPADIDKVVKLGVQQRAIAQKYGLRYIAYEGGQHVVLAKNVALEEEVERDPRMYFIYKHYLTAWRDQIGDNLNLYNHVGPISGFGGWGLSEYVGQSLSQAPKLRAVRDFLELNTASLSVAARLRKCPNQSAVAASATCGNNTVRGLLPPRRN